MLGKTYESLKSSVICDDIAIITAEIVRINDRVGSFAGDVVHVSLQALSVCLTDDPSYAGRNYAFPSLWETLL